MNPYSRLIPRLNGTEIEERLDYYLGLVKKGVAGFIVFGGELEAVRSGIKKLQDSSNYMLMIASDLEQGLGQQIEGGTVFPPAMAIASAIRSQKSVEATLSEDSHREASRSDPQRRPASGSQKLLRDTFNAFAVEAKYVGINTILAPVLDINTNPDNPIIATRAFGEDPETVSYFGCEIVRILQQNGIMTCGKHFPGHGDTEIDSHISLPIIKKDLKALEGQELVPFKRAINEGVGMIMLGHLSVPSIDSSGKPASISDKVVSYLRTNLGFKGLVITDAMNMGAITGFDENEASLMALNAGVDLILHPTDPDRTAAYFQKNNYPPYPLHLNLTKSKNDISPDFHEHRKLSEQLTRMAISVEGNEELKIGKPFVIILNEDEDGIGRYFIDMLRRRFPEIRHLEISKGKEIPRHLIPRDHDIIVLIFSRVKAWKGKAGWLRNTIEKLGGKAKIFISFGNPYVLRDLPNVTKIYAYWDSEPAQRTIAERLSAF